MSTRQSRQHVDNSSNTISLSFDFDSSSTPRSKLELPPTLANFLGIYENDQATIPSLLERILSSERLSGMKLEFQFRNEINECHIQQSVKSTSPQQSSAETRTLSQTSQQPVGRSVTSLASLRNSTTSSNTTNTTNTNTSSTSTSAYNTSQHGATQSMTQTDEDSPFRRARAVFENIQRNNNASGSQSSNTSNTNRSNRHP
ncbi:hypothetical protein C9374_013071 [Naegleria lovaniensis]|uniref:Uncharacterized protein n=1 Tax=Naegleria lovaniensis TaxID=51637 RepID=A0AA88GBT3_NAELO|nr:uncharacterized protein C9374_013071 [Naegleria lovaniensis]KAG2372864.1 hypothetical protein C9374_013071 [Naegleria lovaniensis]